MIENDMEIEWDRYINSDDAIYDFYDAVDEMQPWEMCEHFLEDTNIIKHLHTEWDAELYEEWETREEFFNDNEIIAQIIRKYLAELSDGMIRDYFDLIEYSMQEKFEEQILEGE